MQIKGLRGKLLRGGLYSNPLMYVNRNQTQGHRSHRVWTKMSFPSLSHLLPKPGTLAGIIGLENQGTITQKHKKYSKLSLVDKLQKEGDNKKNRQAEFQTAPRARGQMVMSPRGCSVSQGAQVAVKRSETRQS